MEGFFILFIYYYSYYFFGGESSGNGYGTVEYVFMTNLEFYDV